MQVENLLFVLLLRRGARAGVGRHHVEHAPHELEAALDGRTLPSHFGGHASEWRHNARLNCLSLPEVLCCFLYNFNRLGTHLFKRNDFGLGVLDSLPRARTERH